RLLCFGNGGESERQRVSWIPIFQSNPCAASKRGMRNSAVVAVLSFRSPHSTLGIAKSEGAPGFPETPRLAGHKPDFVPAACAPGGLFSVTLSVAARLHALRPRILHGLLSGGVRTFLSRANRERPSANARNLPCAPTHARFAVRFENAARRALPRFDISQ